MRITRLTFMVLAVLLSLVTVARAFAYEAANAHFTGGGTSTGQYSTGFAATGLYYLGFGTSGTVPSGTHAVAPTYSVDGSETDWVSTANISGNFTTTLSPRGPFADIVEAAATAGHTPSQFPFIIITLVLIIAISLATSYVWRRASANSPLFAKGAICIGVIGLLVALRYWDWWMLLFFIMFFAASGLASRHQSWQN